MYPLLLSDLNQIWIFSTDFRKRELSCSKRSDGRTHTKQSLSVAFRNFANAPKNKTTCTIYIRIMSLCRSWRGVEEQSHPFLTSELDSVKSSSHSSSFTRGTPIWMFLEAKPDLLLLPGKARVQTQLKTADGNYRVTEKFNRNTQRPANCSIPQLSSQFCHSQSTNITNNMRMKLTTVSVPYWYCTVLYWYL